MTGWSDGYVTDMVYEAYFFRDLTPDYIRLAMLLHGVDMPARKNDEPLRYLELGYGQGVSLNVHSAAVQGEFWGTDFNPDHTLRATETAQAAQLDTRLLNASFAELNAKSNSGDLPQFDIIALHGVWSWISDDSRGHILSLINRNLKMGGAVYISYNALPGWAPFMPVRDLMALHADTMGAQGQSSAARMTAAYTFARQLNTAGAGYFAANPGAAQRLEKMEGMSLAYTTQEYLNRHWRPFYFADVAAALNMAKCTFVTSTRLLTQLEICLPEGTRPLLAGAPNPALRETLRDFALNQQFRADIFVKGARHLSPRELMARMGTLRLALACPLEAVNLTVAGPVQVQLKEDIYTPLLAALADNNYAPKTMEQLEDHPLLTSMSSAVLTEAISVLAGAGYCHPACVPDPTQQDACARLNRVLCERARMGEASNILASPLLAGGVTTSRIEQLFLLAHSEDKGTPAEWAQDAWNVFAGGGEQLQRDGVTLTYEESLQEITTLAETFVKQRLPWLQAVQALPVLLVLLTCLLTGCVDFGSSPKIAVVDTARILTESAPAKAGEAHLQQVRDVLQKGLDDVQALYKGAEQSPEAQQAVREAHTALERQLAVERQAVLQILGNLLDKAVRQWRVAYPAHTIVISRQTLLDSDASLDVTPAIMTEINTAQAVFPPLPTVTVNASQGAQNVTPQSPQSQDGARPGPIQRRR